MAIFEITFADEKVDIEKLKSQLSYEVSNIQEISKKKEGVFFKVKNRLEKINPEEIRWIQASDIYSIIRTEKARFLVSHTLKSLEQKLSNNDFIRVHRSYLVNVSEIRAIDDGQLLIGEDLIPVGQTHKEAVLERLDFM